MIAGISHLLPDRYSESDKQAINDVLDAATEWAEGRMPFSVAASIGTIERNGKPSPAFARLLATVLTSPRDPRRRHLDDLIDYLLAVQGLTKTPHGLATQRDLTDIRDAEEIVRRTG